MWSGKKKMNMEFISKFYAIKGQKKKKSHLDLCMEDYGHLKFELENCE